MEFLNFTKLDHLGCATFVTTRVGGVSTGPYASLNLSYSTGEAKDVVTTNRSRVAAALAIKSDRLVSAQQRHGVRVWEVTASDLTTREADILVTAEQGIALMVLTADCVPVVLFDPVEKIVGAVHAGWRGTVAGATNVAVTTMVERFRCSAKNIYAGIGPAIAPEHYEVGPEVIEALHRTFRSNDDRAQILTPTSAGHALANLVTANIVQLKHTGVLPEHIESLNLDTFSRPEQFYSARRQKPFGCFGTGIMLTSQ